MQLTSCLQTFGDGSKWPHPNHVQLLLNHVHKTAYSKKSITTLTMVWSYNAATPITSDILWYIHRMLTRVWRRCWSPFSKWLLYQLTLCNAAQQTCNFWSRTHQEATEWLKHDHRSMNTGIRTYMQLPGEKVERGISFHSTVACGRSGEYDNHK